MDGGAVGPIKVEVLPDPKLEFVHITENEARRASWNAMVDTRDAIYIDG